MDSFQIINKKLKLLFSLGFKAGAASIFAAVLSELVRGFLAVPRCCSDGAVLPVGLSHPVTGTDLLFSS